MNGFPVRLDDPSPVASVAYGNNTFVVESYILTETDGKVSVLGGLNKLRDLVTGEVISAESTSDGGRVPQQAEELRGALRIHLPPHSTERSVLSDDERLRKHGCASQWMRFRSCGIRSRNDRWHSNKLSPDVPPLHSSVSRRSFRCRMLVALHNLIVTMAEDVLGYAWQSVVGCVFATRTPPTERKHAD